MSEIINGCQEIEDKIYSIRGKYVMLDSDLARLFNMETRVLNQNVLRNLDKFLGEVTFKLSDDESKDFLITNSDKKIETRGGKYKNPRVFTVEGISVLVSIIRKENKEVIFQKIEKGFQNKSGLIIVKDAVNTGKIEDLIYEVRGVQVMLDSDVASLYKVPSKRINEAVKNNIERFPENFCFQLTLEEYNSLRSKISTLDVKRGKFRKYLPYVFTEQGIAMLSGIIRNPIAVKVSIAIMNAFVLMRKIISKDLLEQKYFKNMLLEHDEKIKLLENSFLEFKNKDQTNIIFFEGQIYDAYSKLVDIMREAKRELIIVDGYADKVVLDMIREIKVPVYLITKKNKVLKELDIRKYKEQYGNLDIIYSDSFHDRYLVLDEREVYHCGTSLNYAGKRTFSINKLEEEEIKNALITKIKEIRSLSKIDKNENR